MRVIEDSIEVTVVITLVLRKLSKALIEGHLWAVLPVKDTDLLFIVTILVITEKLSGDAYD